MKKVLITVLVTLICSGSLAWASGQSHSHWTYSGETGPAQWGGLAPEYAACSEGRSQSPVNLTGMMEANLPAIKFSYDAVKLHIVNNGHTIKADYGDGSGIKVEGHDYKLLQFHFHSPSENRINGRSFPLEAHLVHADQDGNLAVIAVMFTQGQANRVLDKIWKYMPVKANATMDVINLTVNAMNLLPADKDYYAFEGSLTTPPCTEGVRWMVLKDPVTISAEQIREFQQTMHHDNNRPVQPLYGRTVYK